MKYHNLGGLKKQKCFLWQCGTRSQKAREPKDEERLLIAQSKMEGGEWIWMINGKYRTDASGKQTK